MLTLPSIVFTLVVPMTRPPTTLQQLRAPPVAPRMVDIPRISLPSVVSDTLKEQDLKDPNGLSDTEYNTYSGAAIGGTLIFFLLPGALIFDAYDALLTVFEDFLFSAIIGGGIAAYLALRKDAAAVRAAGPQLSPFLRVRPTPANLCTLIRSNRPRPRNCRTPQTSLAVRFLVRSTRSSRSSRIAERGRPGRHVRCGVARSCSVRVPSVRHVARLRALSALGWRSACAWMQSVIIIALARASLGGLDRQRDHAVLSWYVCPALRSTRRPHVCGWCGAPPRWRLRGGCGVWGCGWAKGKGCLASTKP